MQVAAIAAYKNLLLNISNIIDVSGYRNDYIAKKMGMKPPNFAVKKKRASWTIDEVEKIMKIVDNEEVTAFLEMQKIKNSETGKALSAQEFESKMGW